MTAPDLSPAEQATVDRFEQAPDPYDETFDALDVLRAAFDDGVTTTAELQPLIDALNVEQVHAAYDADLLTTDQAAAALMRAQISP